MVDRYFPGLTPTRLIDGVLPQILEQIAWQLCGPRSEEATVALQAVAHISYDRKVSRVPVVHPTEHRYYRRNSEVQLHCASVPFFLCTVFSLQKRTVGTEGSQAQELRMCARKFCEHKLQAKNGVGRPVYQTEHKKPA